MTALLWGVVLGYALGASSILAGSAALTLTMRHSHLGEDQEETA